MEMFTIVFTQGLYLWECPHCGGDNVDHKEKHPQPLEEVICEWCDEVSQCSVEG